MAIIAELQEALNASLPIGLVKSRDSGVVLTDVREEDCY
jgi:hypothetical protein